MGSLKISSDPSGVIMSPFKATLWLSVLTVSTVVNHVGAAPVELVAGRVVSHEPLTQNLGFVGDINSLRSLFANGIPAGISLVRTVPQVSHVNHVSHAVPTVNAVSTVPVAKTILHTPASSSVVHHHQQHHPVTHVAAVPAVESVRVANTHLVHTPLATPLPTSAPAIVPTISQRLIPEEEFVPANYNFGYSVSDVVSGDSKTRQETREGDLVTGSYSVADPDGRIRTVTYTADSVHGFQAKVTYDGEEGPVAIPFNPPPTPVNIVANAPGPAPINVVAQAPAPAPAPFPAPITPPAPVATPATEEVIIAKDAPAPASPTTLTTSAPVTTPVTAPQPLTFPSRALPAVPETPASTIRTAPRLLNAFPQVDLNQLIRVLNHNDVHALHNLPGGVTTVRTGAGAPVDLSQFTFLSGGQVLV